MWFGNCVKYIFLRPSGHCRHTFSENTFLCKLKHLQSEKNVLFKMLIRETHSHNDSKIMIDLFVSYFVTRKSFMLNMQLTKMRVMHFQLTLINFNLCVNFDIGHSQVVCVFKVTECSCVYINKKWRVAIALNELLCWDKKKCVQRIHKTLTEKKKRNSGSV